MRSKRVLTVFLVAGLLFLFAAQGWGAMLDVSFTDNDGSQWTGQVDTVADTLQIDAWVTGSGGSQSFYTPQSAGLPWTWGAVATDGTPYDVSNSFDGTNMTGWGFLSPLATHQLTWVDGPVDFMNNNKYLGWGIGLVGAGYSDGNLTQTFNVPVGQYGSSMSRADSVTVTAVPEPSTFALTTLGVLGLMARGWRRRGIRIRG